MKNLDALLCILGAFFFSLVSYYTYISQYTRGEKRRKKKYHVKYLKCSRNVVAFNIELKPPDGIKSNGIKVK